MDQSQSYNYNWKYNYDPRQSDYTYTPSQSSIASQVGSGMGSGVGSTGSSNTNYSYRYGYQNYQGDYGSQLNSQGQGQGQGHGNEQVHNQGHGHGQSHGHGQVSRYAGGQGPGCGGGQDTPVITARSPISRVSPPSNLSSPMLNMNSISSNLNSMTLGTDKEQNQMEKLKLQLSLKTQIINNLKKRIETDTGVNENFYKLHKETVDKLKEKETELSRTNEILETLMVSLTLSNSGKFDEQELTHKIINKIKGLTAENDRLLKMVSESSKSSLLVEIGILKNKIQGLEKELSEK
ncbi:hypothetical protein CLIB1444_11S03158 [[Candida] jaroonii]|uniref:Uncharacterized protein n=1 Tax=[Candida] jaroonii TaxID=467808 RepID=A0ACA9YD78_9ASCO|nr:hypothetical protein CLIB1444_11S03158 [[Candida] jaroonii]